MVVWSNYSDVTRVFHPKWWFSKGNPLISGKSRLVKYYNLARWWFFKIAPQDFGSLVCLQVFVIFKFGIFSQDAPVVTDQHLGWAFFSILKRINCFFGWKTNIYQPIYIYICWKRNYTFLASSLIFLVYSQNHKSSLPNIFCPKNVASRKSCHQNQASQERSLRLERMREFQEFERQQAEQEARHSNISSWANVIYLPLHHQLGKATNLW